MLGKYIAYSCTIIGLLVVFVPWIFYWSSSASLTEMEFQATDQYGSSITEFNSNIEDVAAKIQHNEARLKELKSSVPWYGEPDARSRQQMQLHTAALEEQYAEMDSLVQTQQAMLVQYRAHAPVWSRLAFEEARELYLARQRAHAGMSARAWTWGMFFDGIFGYGRRSEDLMGQIVMAMVKLAWNLSFGAIISLIDFCIRLPFYLKEYDLYSSDEMLLEDGNYEPPPRNEQTGAGQGDEWDEFDGSATGGGDAKEQRVMRSSKGELSTNSGFHPGSLTGRSGLPSTTLAYLVMSSGAVVGTVFILLLIWSPCIGCALLKYRQIKNDPNYAARFGQRRAHYD